MRTFAIAVGLILAGTAGSAATLSADTASSSTQHSGSYDAGNTIDGSGLTAIGDPGLIHSAYSTNNHWTAAPGDLTDAWIEWGFNTAQTIGGLYIWNHLSNNIAAHSGYEPTLFDLTFYDSSNNILASYDDVALTPDTAGASEAFTLDSALSNVSAIRFDVEAVQDPSNWTGLAEVLFDDSTISGARSLAPVPVPASLPLLLAGFGALGLMRRRNKRG